MNPHKPHLYEPDEHSGACKTCARSNSPYARRNFHTPPFQTPLADLHTGAAAESTPSAPLTSSLPAYMTDMGFNARMARLQALSKAPAVSIPTGGEKENTMPMNFKLSVKDYASIIEIVNAINAVKGVSVLSIKEETPDEQLRPTEAPQGRSWSTDSHGMACLLQEADNGAAVMLDYTSAAGDESRGRRVVKVSFDGDVLLAVDPARANSLRSFKLDNMSRVTIL